MPGESDNGEPKTPKSELESLFDSAVAPMPTASTTYECSKCHKPCIEQCAECLGPMCENHRSPFDPTWCCNCLPDNTIVEEPLKNPEGNIVGGRHLIVEQTAYKTISKRIADMNDDELGNYIIRTKGEISLQNRAIDLKRINLNTAQMEQTQRVEIKRRKLSAARFAPVASRPKVVASQQSKKAASAASSQQEAIAFAMKKALEFLMDKTKTKAKPNETN